MGATYPTPVLEEVTPSAQAVVSGDQQQNPYQNALLGASHQQLGRLMQGSIGAALGAPIKMADSRWPGYFYDPHKDEFIPFDT